MTTLILIKPNVKREAQETKRAQQELAEKFLKLLNEWCQQLSDLGQESPVLSVKALDADRLQLILRNGSRWIVQRAGKER